MARAIRALASSALIVHSEKGLDSRKLDEGRMAHPPFGMPLPCESNYGRLKIVPSMRQSYTPETHPCRRVPDPGFFQGCRGLRLRGHRWKCPGAFLWEWTPTSGDVLPHFWQRKPMLPMKVSRLTPLRQRSRGKREVCDPAAAAGQPQECVALVHRLPDTPGSPVGIGFHGGDHCIKGASPRRRWPACFGFGSPA
jgi:hypothetical protein